MLDRSVAWVERYGWLIAGIACAAAVFLFAVSISEWDTGNGSLPSLLRTPEWLQPVLAAGMWSAFIFCVLAMVGTVAVEARRMQVMRDHLDWAQSKAATPSRSQGGGATHEDSIRSADEAPCTEQER